MQDAVEDRDVLAPSRKKVREDVAERLNGVRKSTSYEVGWREVQVRKWKYRRRDAAFFIWLTLHPGPPAKVSAVILADMASNAPSAYADVAHLKYVRPLEKPWP